MHIISAARSATCFSLPVLKSHQSAWCPRCNAKMRDGRDWSLTRLGSHGRHHAAADALCLERTAAAPHLLGVRIDANVLQGIWQMTAQGDPLTAAMVLFCAVARRCCWSPPSPICGLATFWG
jgi:paraquat-inducible protein A